MQVMHSMELTDEEQLEASMPIPMPERPKYPYGLRICLTEKELEKLGLDPASACIGGIVHLHALAAITSVSCDETEGGSRCRIELQIESMAVESEDEENEMMDAAEDRRSVRMKRLYGPDED